MSASDQARDKDVASFRTRLFTAIMLIVASLTALGLYLAQRKVTSDAERNLQENFQGELSSLHKLEELRHAALVDRCNALAAKSRIHAAIEDNAIDLLYPSAKDELRNLMEGDEPPPEQAAQSLHATFYRFLDGTGTVLKPPNPNEVGQLDAKAETQLSLTKLPDTQQIGYLQEKVGADGGTVAEVLAVPIFSTDTGDVISALVVGFKPFQPKQTDARAEMKSGIWVNGQLHLPSLPKSAETSLSEKIANAVRQLPDRAENKFRVNVDGSPQLVFYKRLNPGSLFPPAYEICAYPLADSSTAEELERSTRYSADASHQLKSPVTVLRVAIESLLAREDFKPEVYEELSALLHQTHRFTGVIDELLLLSRMDAGHLQIASTPVNLSQLIDEWLDDLGALPDSPDVKIEKEFPVGLFVAGERQYTSLIVQNLLENARKYNRPCGRIRVSAHANGSDVVLTIGNTGRTIPPGENIFERFHHNSTPSAVSGHGIGLNLARELARLHGGDLRLVRSEHDWTEFEVRFSAADGVNAVA